MLKVLGISSTDSTNKALDNVIRESCLDILPKRQKIPKTINWFQKNKEFMEALIKQKRAAWDRYERKSKAVDTGVVSHKLHSLGNAARKASEMVKSEGLRLRNEFQHP